MPPSAERGAGAVCGNRAARAAEVAWDGAGAVLGVSSAGWQWPWLGQQRPGG